MAKITVDQLLKIAPLMPKARAEKFIDPLNQTLEKFQITTPKAMAMFLAQVLHESGSFRYMEELASGQAYEGRKDLGNTVPGDGVRYKGRGAVQITGRTNYGEVSKALGVDFVSKPELLATLPYAMLSAGWFWDTRGLTAISNAGNEEAFKKVTKRINGGYNGYDDRKQYWEKAKKVLGA